MNVIACAAEAGEVTANRPAIPVDADSSTGSGDVDSVGASVSPPHPIENTKVSTTVRRALGSITVDLCVCLYDINHSGLRLSRIATVMRLIQLPVVVFSGQRGQSYTTVIFNE